MEKITAPIAKKERTVKKINGFGLEDDYGWIRDKQNEEVINYLKAENSYTDMKTKHLDEFKNRLYDEIKSRIKETDETVPYRFKNYYYFSRTFEGKEYRAHYRKRELNSNEEELLFDVNKMAENYKYFNLENFAVNPNEDIIAYSIDINGYEDFSLYFKSIKDNRILEDKLENISWTFEWGNENTIYYSVLEEKTKRSYRIYEHKMGTKQDQDILIYEETDEEWNVGIDKSKDGEYLFIFSEASEASEVRFKHINDLNFRLILERKDKQEYSVMHYKGYFYFISNHNNAINFALYRSKVDEYQLSRWENLIPHNPKRRIQSIHPIQNCFAVTLREEGLSKIFIFYEKDSPKNHFIKLPEEIYGLYPGNNFDKESDFFRFNYTSLITPMSVFDYFPSSDKLLLKKVQEVKNYDKNNYVTRREFVKVRDGTMVPISIVHKKDLEFPAPTLFHGYGSYGINTDTVFNPSRISLLERNIAFVIIHVRGGSEMGREWYLNGKLLKKKHTFYDFIDCIDFLVQNNFTTPNLLAAEGGSAGGLLMGAITNMRPELFKLIIARVPFVDIMNTMLDPSIPLTTVEYKEWGNPNEKSYFDYMLSYSPYDNVTKKNYPTMLVTAGLNDPRVHYWEPTKWVAKLRALKTDDNELLLRINMGEGHLGSSARYEYMKETAFIYSFIIDNLLPSKDKN